MEEEVREWIKKKMESNALKKDVKDLEEIKEQTSSQTSAEKAPPATEEKLSDEPAEQKTIGELSISQAPVQIAQPVPEPEKEDVPLEKPEEEKKQFPPSQSQLNTMADYPSKPSLFSIKSKILLVMIVAMVAFLLFFYFYIRPMFI